MSLGASRPILIRRWRRLFGALPLGRTGMGSKLRGRSHAIIGFDREQR